MGSVPHAPGIQEDSPRYLPMAVAIEPSRSTPHELWLLVVAMCCACAGALHGKGHRAARSGDHVTRWVTRQRNMVNIPAFFLNVEI